MQYPESFLKALAQNLDLLPGGGGGFTAVSVVHLAEQ